MQDQVVLFCNRANGPHGFQRPDRTATGISRLLNHDHPCARRVATGTANRRLRLLSGKNAAVTIERAKHCARKNGRTAAFRIDNMCRLVGDNLVTGSAVHHDRNLIAHRARRHKNRSLFP
jgi:hypothetical protein